MQSNVKGTLGILKAGSCTDLGGKMVMVGVGPRERRRKTGLKDRNCVSRASLSQSQARSHLLTPTGHLALHAWLKALPRVSISPLYSDTKEAGSVVNSLGESLAWTHSSHVSCGQ